MFNRMILLASVLSVATLLSTHVWAGEQSNISYSQCALVDDLGTLVLSEEKVENLAGRAEGDLTVIQFLQIGFMFPEVAPGETLKKLEGESANGQVLYKQGRFNGQDLDIFLYFPGGRATGFVFHRFQFQTALAQIDDSKLSCL